MVTLLGIVLAAWGAVAHRALFVDPVSAVVISNEGAQRRILARIEELATLVGEALIIRLQAAKERDALVLSALTHLRLPSNSEIKPISACSMMSTGTTPPSARSDYYGGQFNGIPPAT
jgi:hypothetical protein